MDRLLEAIWFAIEKHKGQKRRGEETPYITHPMGVALLLSKVTNDEDVLIAGILHDCIEDTSTNKEEIEKMFGKKVAEIVVECSQDDMSKPWKDRKAEQLNRTKTISKNAALVRSADFLHNIDNLYRGIQTTGMSFFDVFHAPAKEKMNYYIKKLELLKKYHPNPLLKEIDKYMKEIMEVTKSKIDFSEP